ncbi:MAG: sigma-70 family RNA polymerase sigma factor [Candidatus Ratteibacteria bacterium]
MSYQELLQRISKKLEEIVKKLQRNTPIFDKNDLYQEALLHLWLNFKEGKLNGKADSYILQGCYFYLKNYIRKNFVKLNLVSLEKTIEENQYFEPGYTENFQYKVFIDHILDNNLLTKREKEVFCFSLEGLTIREIGKKLGISHVRVVKLQRRIREKLKPYLVGEIKCYQNR